MAGRAGARNLPVVLVADGFGDGEAETRTWVGFVGLVESIEDFVEVFGSNCCAVVGNGEAILVENDSDALMAVLGGVI